MKRLYQSTLLYCLKAFSRLAGRRYYTIEYRTSLDDNYQMEERRIEGTNLFLPVNTPYLAIEYRVLGTKHAGTIYQSLAETLIDGDSKNSLRNRVVEMYGLPEARTTLVDVSRKPLSFFERMKYIVSSKFMAWSTANG